MADVVESGIDAAAEAFKRMHGNVCYPSASDGEAKWAAEEIVKAYLGSARLSQAGAGGVVVTTDMVNAAWNEAKTRRMTGLPTDFRAVLEAALTASPSAGEPVAYASTGQIAALEDRPADEGGVYIPLRKTPVGLFQMPLYATPPATPVQTASVEAVLSAYEQQTEELPLGASGPERGNSTYNWRKLIIKELRELAASLTPAPAQEDGD
ncbi:hypothetical protein ACWIGM_09165 [Bosea sp. NPDC055332]